MKELCVCGERGDEHILCSSILWFCCLFTPCSFKILEIISVSL